MQKNFLKIQHPLMTKQQQNKKPQQAKNSKELSQHDKWYQQKTYS